MIDAESQPTAHPLIYRAQERALLLAALAPTGSIGISYCAKSTGSDGVLGGSGARRQRSEPSRQARVMLDHVETCRHPLQCSSLVPSASGNGWRSPSTLPGDRGAGQRHCGAHAVITPLLVPPGQRVGGSRLLPGWARSLPRREGAAPAVHRWLQPVPPRPSAGRSALFQEVAQLGIPLVAMVSTLPAVNTAKEAIVISRLLVVRHRHDRLIPMHLAGHQCPYAVPSPRTSRSAGPSSPVDFQIGGRWPATSERTSASGCLERRH